MTGAGTPRSQLDVSLDVSAVPVRPGDVVTATADRLGSVELACT